MPKIEPPIRKVYPGKGGVGRAHWGVTPTASPSSGRWPQTAESWRPSPGPQAVRMTRLKAAAAVNRKSKTRWTPGGL